MHANKPLRIFALTFVVALLLWSGGSIAEDDLKPAPDFTLADLCDNEVALKQYRGHIVLLDFFATWCFPCRQAIPELIRLRKKYQDNKRNQSVKDSLYQPFPASHLAGEYPS